MNILTKNRIYFLLKDPRWSFIWWRVNWLDALHSLMARSGRTCPSSSPALRIHDVTDIIFDGQNSHSYIEIKDGIGNTDHWYFNLQASGRNYCAEVGFTGGPGWFLIARSNTLFVPRAGPSTSHDESWSTSEMT